MLRVVPPLTELKVEVSKLVAVAAKQYGCVTTEQALGVMTKNQWKYLAKKRVVVWKWPGVYIVDGFPNTWHQRAVAAVLSIPGAALSHRSAARWWGLTWVPSQRIELTMPDVARLEREEVKIRHSRQLEGFVVESGGIRVTTMARTLVDLSGCTSPKLLSNALDQACNLNLVKHDEIHHCFQHMVMKGRPKITRLRKLVDGRGAVDESLDSQLERKARRWIKEAGLPEPVGQRGVVANGTYYRPDLSYPDHKIIVEPDGPHHLLPSVTAYDRQRDADFNIDDWIVIHVTPEMEPPDFIPRLRTALKKRSTPSSM